MIKMSALRNTPVIIDQKPIGIVQNLCMDMVQKRVCAFSVSCGLHGRRFIKSTDVCNLSNGFLIAEKAYYRIQMNGCNQALFVRDSTGILIGYVSDYAISENEMQISALEMRIGFRPQEYRTRVWVIDYAYQLRNHEVIVPASLGCELI